jgi:polyhydroxyalkanoate synthesis repressor PhaR
LPPRSAIAWAHVGSNRTLATIGVSSRGECMIQEKTTATEEIRLIKRYSNRKLYDTKDSRYVTLEDIGQMIKAGEELKIIDNKSKDDLTTVTLTQIIFEEEKRESRMPLGMLRNLIQTGGTTLQDFFDRSVRTPVVEIRDSAQKSVEKGVVEIKQSAQQLREAAARQVNELTDSARRIFSREERKADEFRRSTQELLEAVEDRLAQRIAFLRQDQGDPGAGQPEQPLREGGTSNDPNNTVEHVLLLRSHLDRLSKMVDNLSAAVSASKPTTPGSAPEPAQQPPQAP